MYMAAAVVPPPTGFRALCIASLSSTSGALIHISTPARITGVDAGTEVFPRIACQSRPLGPVDRLHRQQYATTVTISNAKALSARAERHIFSTGALFHGLNSSTRHISLRPHLSRGTSLNTLASSHFQHHFLYSCKFAGDHFHVSAFARQR